MTGPNEGSILNIDAIERFSKAPVLEGDYIDGILKAIGVENDPLCRRALEEMQELVVTNRFGRPELSAVITRVWFILTQATPNRNGWKDQLQEEVSRLREEIAQNEDTIASLKDRIKLSEGTLDGWRSAWLEIKPCENRDGFAVQFCENAGVFEGLKIVRSTYAEYPPNQEASDKPISPISPWGIFPTYDAAARAVGRNQQVTDNATPQA
jgi:hypothetical protein